jgi:hypothetical protein
MTDRQKTAVFTQAAETDKPNGPGAAAILAAGIGSAIFGLVTLASEVSGAIGRLLNFYDPVGPLSGKTTFGIIAWLIVWFVLARLWQKETVNMTSVNIAALMLLGVGFLLTFPPVWELFGG